MIIVLKLKPHANKIKGVLQGCKRDVAVRDRDETNTLVQKMSRDREVRLRPRQFLHELIG